MTDPETRAACEEEAENEQILDSVEPTEEAHFEPVIKLETVEVKNLEEEEEVVYKCRARLFRFDKAANEWKERGTGDVKLLKHLSSGKIRLVMRREKTHKICANHSIGPEIDLQPNIGSDRSWVYHVSADMSEGEPRPETHAIRFANSEIANEFKKHVQEAKITNAELSKPSTEAKKEEDKKEEEKSDQTKSSDS